MDAIVIEAFRHKRWAMKALIAACQTRPLDELMRAGLLGQGEALFAGLDLLRLGYHVAEYAPTARATHVVLRKKP